MVDHPFTALLEIARLARINAQGLPAQVDIQRRWSGIGFQLGGVQLVIAMSDVAEILDVPPVTRLPGVQPWAKGVANVRGRLLPVIDFSQFLEISDGSHDHKRGVLVIEKGDVYCGLIVDQVYGMKNFPAEALLDENHDEEFDQELDVSIEGLRHLVQGAYLSDDTIWAVFNPVLLELDKQFMNAALQ